MVRFSAASLRQSPAYRFAARLTLLFFALRVILPAGYMPDPGALKHGQVRIVICTGSGTQALLVDAAGRPVTDGGGDAAPHGVAADCIFGMTAAQAFTLPVPIAALARPGVVRDVPPSGGGEALLPRALGPPLGSRAPPILLG